MDDWLAAEWLTAAGTVVSWDEIFDIDVVRVVCINVNLIFNSLFRFNRVVFVLKCDERYCWWSEFVCLPFDWGEFGLDQAF
jgi:hypothetical protein